MTLVFFKFRELDNQNILTQRREWISFFKVLYVLHISHTVITQLVPNFSGNKYSFYCPLTTTGLLKYGFLFITLTFWVTIAL